MRQEILRMERVTCVERGIKVLDDFSLGIFAGEIMGLLPINSHGLSALLRLFRLNTPLEYGYVYYREKQVNTWRASKPRHNRIGIIQPESCLVEGLTVADNIFVLRHGCRTWLMRPGVLRKQLEPFLEALDIEDISGDTCVEELSSFQRVVVDVLKAVVAGCRLIVLRDISPKISEAELLKIHGLMRHYSAQGISFLYIDYHFEELSQVCQRVAVMSNGTIIKVLSGDESTPETLKSYTRVFEQKVESQLSRHRDDCEPGRPAFEARGVSGALVDNLSFGAAPGECVVLQDVENRILGELLDMLTGDITPVQGCFCLDGRPYAPTPGKEIAIIQELPTRTMVFSDMSYADNLCFNLDGRIPELWLSSRAREGVVREVSGLDADSSAGKRVGSLSEMEKYELVYRRVAVQKPRAVFCVQPFRRADMAHRMHIWELIKMLTEKDIAVFILAVNLADSLSLADKLIRVKNGQPPEVYLRRDFDAVPISSHWIR